MTEPARPSSPLPREIAVRFVPIIRRLAHRLSRKLPSHILVDDLIGAGFVGLVEAYRRNDPTVSDRFDAFAEARIRGAMIDELRSSDPLSRDERAFARREAAARRDLENRLGRAATDHEAAEALGVSVEVLRQHACRAGSRTTSVSVDAAHEAEESTQLQIADARAVPADELVESAQSRSSLALAMEALPPRLRQVLELYYGEELTLRDIGGILGVTESRICQLHAEAVKRLRAQCAGEDNAVAPSSGPSSATLA